MTREEKIRQVHLATSVLKISDVNYRGLLNERWGVTSSKALKDEELDTLLAHFRSLGWRPWQRGRAPAAKAGAKATKRKLTQDELLTQVLSEGGHARSYADGIAKKIALVDKYEWCTKQQRAAVIAAIIRGNQRKGKDK
jgi:phage gp16-like protein